MAWGLAIAAGVQAVGSILGARSARKAKKQEAAALEAQGAAEQEAAYFEAGQMEQAAKTQQATAQFAAQEELRKSELLQSRALAIAGASGAGVNDPTVMKIISDLAAEGRMAADTQLYTGNEAARAMRVGAKVRRWEGDQARAGRQVQSSMARAERKAITTQSILDVAGTAASWYDRMPKDSSGKLIWRG